MTKPNEELEHEEDDKATLDSSDQTVAEPHDERAEDLDLEPDTVPVSISLLIGIEQYLASRPIGEAVQGWADIKDILDGAGVQR